MSLRHPLGRALGRGSAKSGVSHWWVQRVTSVALVPLTLWFVLRIVTLPDYGYDTVREWIGSSWTPIGLILLIGAMAWHSALGIQVVIEDYVPNKLIKVMALFTSTIFHVLVAVAGVYAVLQIAG
jgi:succinate dehydrogenase / fumarate reductase membrane anchor subunit